ncbi:hypothetical protein L484_020549 [Morus notabilis]|uniref:Uncharacterized protein n=1 Tax=Morus notabilis TaxID=981085 RepID=W9S0S2_9ROSA|nr:hypothetical protein L484_020549 [Morus notabilis]
MNPFKSSFGSAIRDIHSYSYFFVLVIWSSELVCRKPVLVRLDSICFLPPVLPLLTAFCASCLWNYGNYGFTPPAWTAELDSIQ